MVAMHVARQSLLLIVENELQCRPMARNLRMLCPVETRALRTSASLPAVVPDAVAAMTPTAPARPELMMPPAFDVIAAVLLAPRADLR